MLVENLGVSSWFVLTTDMWYEYCLNAGSDVYGIDIRNRSVEWIDDGNVRLSSSTWPQLGKAITGLLDLKELPEDENDKSPTLSQLRNQVLYVASLSSTQGDISERVKKATGTTDKDWTMTKHTSKGRFDDRASRLQKGDLSGFGKQLSGRLTFASGEGDFETQKGLHNKILGLSHDGLDTYTKIVVKAIEIHNALYSTV